MITRFVLWILVYLAVMLWSRYMMKCNFVWYQKRKNERGTESGTLAWGALIWFILMVFSFVQMCLNLVYLIRL